MPNDKDCNTYKVAGDSVKGKLPWLVKKQITDSYNMLPWYIKPFVPMEKYERIFLKKLYGKFNGQVMGCGKKKKPVKK